MNPLHLETMSMRPQDAAQKERQRAEKVADQFETIFVRTMVSSLRQTGSVGGPAGMFGEGPGSDTYADWFDQNLAQKVAESGHIGIKDQLMRDFERSGEIRKQARVTQAEDQVRAAAAATDRSSFAAIRNAAGVTHVVP